MQPEHADMSDTHRRLSTCYSWRHRHAASGHVIDYLKVRTTDEAERRPDSVRLACWTQAQ